MPTDPPEGLPDRPLLRELAGAEPFVRGERILTEGGVRQLHVWPDRASAKVDGTPFCRVKLWRARGELQWSCTCPAGREARPCEHAVAVGLAWMANGAAAQPSKTPVGPDHQRRDAQRQAIADHLHTADQERLIALVLEATDYDDILRRRLLLESIHVGRPKGKRRARGAAATPPDFAAYREILREAIEVSDYVDYDAMPDYAQGVEEAIAPLGELLRVGRAAEVIELAESALVSLDAAAEWLDGSDGSLNRVYDELQRVHYEACRAARPDPEALAARLLAYELDGGLGVFSNAVNNYADVLGERGVRAWRTLLETQWSALSDPPQPAPGDVPRVRPIDHRRYQLQALMEGVAAAVGDVDGLIAIKERDLSSPHDFLALAELCRSAGRHAEASEWAERGLRAFPTARDHAGLRDFARGPGPARP